MGLAYKLQQQRAGGLSRSTQALLRHAALAKDTTQRLMVRTLAARAASGNIQATLMDMIMQVFGPGDRGSEATRLSPQDQELLDRYLLRMGAGLEDAADELTDAVYMGEDG